MQKIELSPIKIFSLSIRWSRLSRVYKTPYKNFNSILLYKQFQSRKRHERNEEWEKNIATDLRCDDSELLSTAITLKHCT